MAALEDSGASDNDKQLELLSALTGLSVDALLDEPLGDFAQQNEAAAFVLVYPQPHAVREAYTLRGVLYLPTLKRERMTAGQFIDWNEIAGQKDGGRHWSQLLSVVLVPEGKTYGSGYDIGEVQEAIAAELCVLDAVALRAFFLTLCAASLTDTLPSLERMMSKTGSRRERRQMRRQMRRTAADLRTSGGGFRALMRYLELPDAVGMLQPICP
jgi:hypothetical protein